MENKETSEINEKDIQYLISKLDGRYLKIGYWMNQNRCMMDIINSRTKTLCIVMAMNMLVSVIVAILVSALL